MTAWRGGWHVSEGQSGAVRRAKKEGGARFIVVGMVGTAVFFTVKMDRGRACLGEAYVVGVSGRSGNQGEKTGSGHPLARSYVVPYGALWWTRLGFEISLVRLMKGSVEESLWTWNETVPTGS